MSEYTFLFIGILAVGVYLGYKLRGNGDEAIRLKKLEIDKELENKVILQRQQIYHNQKATIRWKVASEFSAIMHDSGHIKALEETFPNVDFLPNDVYLTELFYDAFHEQSNKHPESYPHRAAHSYLLFMQEELHKEDVAHGKTLKECLIEQAYFWKNEYAHRHVESSNDPIDWQMRREIVYQRDGKQCQKCGVDLFKNTYHVHHILERKNGGDHSLDNLVLLCPDCHTCMPEHDFMRDYISTKWEHSIYMITSYIVWEFLVEKFANCPSLKVELLHMSDLDQNQARSEAQQYIDTLRKQIS